MVCKSLLGVLTTTIPGSIHLNKDVQLACFSPNSALDEIGCWARSASHPRVLPQACDSLCSCESLFMCDSFFMRDSLFTQPRDYFRPPQRRNFFFLQTHVHHVASLNEIGAVGINQVPFSIFAKSSCYFLLARMKQSF